MTHILDHIRFRPEQQLLEDAFERYGLDDLLQHHAESGALEDRYDFVLSTQLRLTPILSPKLCSLLDDVRAALSFEEKIDLFVSPDAAVNAFAMYSIGEGRPHVLSVTSGLVERMTDDEVTKPLEVQARDFLLAGGLLAAHADKDEIADDQWDMLLQWLLPLCADPEAEASRIETFAEAQEILDTSAAWLYANAGQERFGLFRQLAHMVALDGLLSSGEQVFMQGVAEKLGIPSKVAKDMLYDVLASYLQSKATRRRRSLKR